MKKATGKMSKRSSLIMWAVIVIAASIVATIFPNAIVQTASTIIALYALYKTVGVPKSYYRRIERNKEAHQKYKQERQEN
ncbi:hypothetical protein LFYK43_02660 [Ligilactobacillus salitolerans]|uniref:Uncharacterized protein n=1 Tax=Ligilactobacillus salitolerans TaxID=1808352 RepID=A0A401IQJ2_9LACO|nr:hypothetical protein [Ligilactobacillus salitolerans]GBG93807.1 hypothetical protein LFYK43_02660 [Ligilactobacillus salitolerans]